MKISALRIIALVSANLLFSGTAQSAALPIRQADAIIERQKHSVSEKANILEDANSTIEELSEKRQILAQKLLEEKTAIDQLNQQLADKKLAAEAERKRLEEIKNMFVHISRYAYNSFGNSYSFGNCTWYVKSRRPDISNSWGNANTWYYRAAAGGWNVGSTPKKGAIGTTTAGLLGHVVYVIGVSLDGQTVTVEDMNYRGLGIVSHRIVNANEFNYIYELN